MGIPGGWDAWGGRSNLRRLGSQEQYFRILRPCRRFGRGEVQCVRIAFYNMSMSMNGFQQESTMASVSVGLEETGVDAG